MTAILAQKLEAQLAYERHLHSVDYVKAREEQNEAREEWDEIPTIVPKVEASRKISDSITSAPTITFDHVWEYFRSMDMSNYLSEIKPTVERRGFSALISKMFTSRLHSPLVEDRNLMFAIALCPLNHDDPVHTRVLQTLYKKLTGTTLNCPTTGPHWEQIGFQGKDPGTDLRGVGFLGLLHPLYMLTDEDLLPLALAMYKLSLHEQQNFPFMVLSINITRIALQGLREGCLNQYCNKNSNVARISSLFYVAIFYRIYKIWQTQNKTIQDSGFVLKDAENYCKRNVRKVLSSIRDYIRKGKAKSESGTQEDKCGRGGKWTAPNPSHSLRHLENQAESEIFI